MRIIRPLLAAAATTLISFLPGATLASSASIENLTANATLGRDGTLDVTENFVYNPGSNTPKQFFRNILTTYQDDQGNNFRIKYHELTATAENPADSLTSTSNSSNVRFTFTPIGDSPHHYTLHYTLSPIVIHGLTNDIFKLNFTGTGWGIPIESATLVMTTPEVTPDNVICTTTSDASTTGKCDITANGNTTTFTTHSTLQPDETMTISSSFPRDSYANYLKVHTPFSYWILFTLVILLILILAVGLPIFLAAQRAKRLKPRTPHPQTPKGTQEKPDHDPQDIK